MLKRIFSIFAISLIITGLFFEGYSLECPVYADDTTDTWMDVTTNEQLVEAFKYYCKSRDLTIEGSIADGVTSFTTKTFNGICNSLGFDLTAIQAHLKYQTDNNGGLRFLFDTTGVSMYNAIFAQFLQDNELEVGDSANKQVYNGYWFTDLDGYSCLVYILPYSTSTDSYYYDPLAYGTPYKNSNGEDVYNLLINSNSSMIIKDTTVSPFLDVDLHINTSSSYKYVMPTRNGTNGVQIYGKYNDGVNTSQDGCLCVFENASSGKLYFGSIGYKTYKNETPHWLWKSWHEITQYTDNENITINIVSNTINNNNYEGDTIINNEGDIINNNPDDPDLPPSNPTIPDDGGWQDFQLPSMPNDWLIYGMEKKFPFDIPFNIMFALSLLNHEPEIPQFEGDIDLKVCTWHYDIDLTPFDDIATILRRFEVLAFIIGLAILTKELIMWG